jgi:hypothetical protein
VKVDRWIIGLHLHAWYTSRQQAPQVRQSRSRSLGIHSYVPHGGGLAPRRFAWYERWVSFASTCSMRYGMHTPDGEIEQPRARWRESTNRGAIVKETYTNAPSQRGECQGRTNPLACPPLRGGNVKGARIHWPVRLYIRR